MNQKITKEAIELADYIGKTWVGRFKIVIEERLSKILPEPENKGLKHIWKYGSADICVFKDNKLICILEPGGSAHFQDETQMKNDRRKWKLCELNGVKCLRIANGVLDQLSNRKKRQLIGSYIFRSHNE